MRERPLPLSCPRPSCELSLCPIDETNRVKVCGQPASNRSAAEVVAGCPPSLDIYGKSSACSDNRISSKYLPWTRQQKSAYGRCLSFFREAYGRGCQMLWLNLTTVVGDTVNGDRLTEHFKELRRRIENRYGYQIAYFKVETTEGGGVLHVVLAIKSDTPVWIGQRWLSSQWLDIHGAHRVWISRIGVRAHESRSVSKYIVSQYVAGGQGSAFKRYSYSWWRCRVALGKGWHVLKREYQLLKRAGDKFSEVVNAWATLLYTGDCLLCGRGYSIINRHVQFST